MRYWYTCLLTLFISSAFAQLKVGTGTTMIVLEGTLIHMNLHGEEWMLDSAAHVINNGEVVLSDSTNVSEFTHFAITGSGTESTTRNLSAVTGVNIGGLGIAFNNSISGLSTITRGHQSLPGSSGPIQRWFNVSSSGGPLTMGNTVTLTYDSLELNGNSSNDLRIIFTSDTAGSWIPLGGIPDAANYNTSAGTDSLGWFTGVSTSLSIASVNDTAFCVSDSLLVDFAGQGFFGPSNVFIFQLSDETGSYSTPAVQDTLLSDNINFDEYLVPALTGSNDYRFRVMSTVPALVIDSGIIIHSLPVISITGLQLQYCANLSSSPVTTLPTGGSYDVSFIDNDSIHPAAASTGIVTFTYSFTDAAGCSATRMDSTEILAAPVISITGLESQYCSNLSASSVITSPAGGNYDVSFMDTDSIHPSAAPTGMITFTYSYTDAEGCTSTLTESTEIIAAPATPVISVVHDTLFSSATSGNQWYYNGSLLSSETNPYLVPAGNGTYQVEVSVGGLCSVMSDSMVYYITAVAATDLNNLITVYPNPANEGFFNIHFPVIAEKGQLDIISNIGQVIKTITISKGTNKQMVPIDDLPAGTYLTRLTADQRYYSTPLVIVK